MTPQPGAAHANGLLATEQRDGRSVALLSGEWVIANAGFLDADLESLVSRSDPVSRLDLSGLTALDTAGAWLVVRTLRQLRDTGSEVELAGVEDAHQGLITQVERSYQPCEIAPKPRNHIVEIIERIGVQTVAICRRFASGLEFLGEVIAAAGRVLLRPARFRLTATVVQMEQVGLNSIPIVGLISFLVGVVLAYQGAAQLRQLGAEVFVVDLISISILRELGVLLTAIMVAGRSGSAFTAQIGTMQVNEEVDAMRSLGMDPLEVLVLPRCIALVLTMPLLTFFADIMGLLGGGLMAWIELDIGPAVFLERLRDSVSPTFFWAGIIKAPVFALIIGIIGCYEGMQVRGSAQAVGKHTTLAVVESVFLVIVADAFFSVFFHLIGF